MDRRKVLRNDYSDHQPKHSVFSNESNKTYCKEMASNVDKLFDQTTLDGRDLWEQLHIGITKPMEQPSVTSMSSYAKPQQDDSYKQTKYIGLGDIGEFFDR